MLEHVITEQPNPMSAGIDRLDTQRILEIMNDQDCGVPRAVRAEIPRIVEAVGRIAKALSQGGRLFLLGAGTSGRLGVLDAIECPPTFGVAPEQVQAIIAGGEESLRHASESVEDDACRGAEDLTGRGFNSHDVLVGIAASGESPYVLGAVRQAREMLAATIGISCTPGSSLAQAVDIPITPVSGPEIITGSTRLKAATATKLVLNMLTTVTMIRLGHVFGNWMINVRPTNRKLRERACRMISELAGVDMARAAELLCASGDSVKTAIVMGRQGLSRQEAEQSLAACGGRISEIIS